MNVRRLTRLTDGFSKKMENHAHGIALHFFMVNFCKPQLTLTKRSKGVHTTPAMAAGLSDRASTVELMLSSWTAPARWRSLAAAALGVRFWDGDGTTTERYLTPLEHMVSTIAQTAAPHDGSFLFLTIVLPIACVLIMTLFETLIDDIGWRRRLVKTGWDTSVLSMGIVGGVTANPSVIATFGSNWQTSLTIAAILICFGTAIGTAYLRKNEKASGTRGFIGMALGGVSLVLPIVMAIKAKL